MVRELNQQWHGYRQAIADLDEAITYEVTVNKHVSEEVVAGMQLASEVLERRLVERGVTKYVEVEP